MSTLYKNTTIRRDKWKSDYIGSTIIPFFVIPKHASQECYYTISDEKHVCHVRHHHQCNTMQCFLSNEVGVDGIKRLALRWNTGQDCRWGLLCIQESIANTFRSSSWELWWMQECIYIYHFRWVRVVVHAGMHVIYNRNAFPMDASILHGRWGLLCMQEYTSSTAEMHSQWMMRVVVHAGMHIIFSRNAFPMDASILHGRWGLLCMQECMQSIMTSRFIILSLK